MRRALSIVICTLLMVTGGFCSFANTDSVTGDMQGLNDAKCVQNICNQYDVSNGMTEEALEAFQSVAFVTAVCDYDAEQNLSTVTYTIDPYEAQDTKVLSNGSKVEDRVATSFTYVYENREIESVQAVTGSITETHILSDVTFVNTIGYTTKTSGGIEWMRMNAGKTKITRFLESNLRNLKIICRQWGVVESGSPDQTVSKTVASPVVNQLYTKSTGWTNFVGKNQGILKVTSRVTYSHGGSSYTVSSYTTFGSGV